MSGGFLPGLTDLGGFAPTGGAAYGGAVGDTTIVGADTGINAGSILNGLNPFSGPSANYYAYQSGGFSWGGDDGGFTQDAIPEYVVPSLSASGPTQATVEAAQPGIVSRNLAWPIAIVGGGVVLTLLLTRKK